MLLSDLVARAGVPGRRLKGDRMFWRKAPVLLPVLLIAAVLVPGTSGCRRDTDDGSDSTIVFTPDTLDYGVWDTDTLVTDLSWLDTHQANLRDVFFEYDSNELTQAATEALMQDAAYLMSNPGFKVLIEGHCDERGTIDYNLALGERRAIMVRDYLVNYGVDSSRLQYVSYGKERPFVTGADEASWAQNRRAHFRALPE
jgi:peptidoglycan-associated lipoprotein